MKKTGHLLTTIHGRNLIGELRNFVHRPYLVVTMEDLWDKLGSSHRVGVDIRPEAMGVTWDDIAAALYRLSSFVEETGLWYTVANVTTITDVFLDCIKQEIETAFGPWSA